MHYVARLEHNKGTDLHIVLDRPRLGPSNRLARRLGSHRILTVQVKDIFCFRGDTLTEFGMTPLVINGRVFRAWYAHDQNIAYVQTKEIPKVVEGKIVGVVPDPDVNSKEFTFKEILYMHNKLTVNEKQARCQPVVSFKHYSLLIMGIDHDEVCLTWTACDVHLGARGITEGGLHKGGRRHQYVDVYQS